MRLRWIGAGLMGLALVAGCGPSGPKTVQVSGTLRIQGKPVEGVEVQFIAEKFAGLGKTNAEGKYRLAAVPGRNKVSFRKFDGGPLKDDPGAGMDAGQFAAMQEARSLPTTVKQLIPQEYRDPATTKMKFDVPSQGTASADFDL